MSAEKNAAVVTLLANEALEAANEQSSLAWLMLIDAALTILVTRIQDAGARRELAAMLAQYVVEQVNSVADAGGAA